MEQQDGPSPNLRVQRADLIHGLRVLAKIAKDKKHYSVVLLHDDGDLVMDIGGNSAAMAAAGYWPGRATVPVHFFSELTKTLPDEEGVLISVDGGRIRIGNSSTGCTWHSGDGATIAIPADPSFLDLLKISLEHDLTDLSRSGLWDVIGRAQSKKDVMLIRALEALEPLGVGRDELEELVDAAILRHK